jgi:NTE family protein
MSATPAKSALLLTGGGARAAYQVGVLRSLARALPQLRFPVLTGVSAGAMNAALLANAPKEFPHAVAAMVEKWEGLTIDDMFRSDVRYLGTNALRWAFRLISGGSRFAPSTRGLVDSSPLDAFLHRVLETDDGVLHGVGENISRGYLSALGITTTSYPTGQSVTWIQGANVASWEGPGQCGAPTELTIDHIRASCALPLLFPAVCLEGRWHGDGGVRLTSPLAPAIQLGADRVLAISNLLAPGHSAANVPGRGYPPPATIMGVLLDSIFVDTLDRDMMDLRLLNQLLVGQPPSSQLGLRPVEVLLLRPSQDLCALAGEFEAELPGAFRHLVRGLGTRETNRSDLLATLLFQPRYIRKVMEIGEQDGRSRLNEIASFLDMTVPEAITSAERRADPQKAPLSDNPFPASIAAA